MKIIPALLSNLQVHHAFWAFGMPPAQSTVKLNQQALFCIAGYDNWVATKFGRFKMSIRKAFIPFVVAGLFAGAATAQNVVKASVDCTNPVNAELASCLKLPAPKTPGTLLSGGAGAGAAAGALVVLGAMAGGGSSGSTGTTSTTSTTGTN